MSFECRSIKINTDGREFHSNTEITTTLYEMTHVSVRWMCSDVLSSLILTTCVELQTEKHWQLWPIALVSSKESENNKPKRKYQLTSQKIARLAVVATWIDRHYPYFTISVHSSKPRVGASCSWHSRNTLARPAYQSSVAGEDPFWQPKRQSEPDTLVIRQKNSDFATYTICS